MLKRFLPVKDLFQRAKSKTNSAKESNIATTTPKSEPTLNLIADQQDLPSRKFGKVTFDLNNLKETKFKSTNDFKLQFRNNGFVTATQVIILITTFLSIFAVLINISANKIIDEKANLLLEKSLKISSSKNEFENLKLISQRIEIHKQYTQEFVPTFKIWEVLVKTPGDFEYKSLSLKEKNISVSAATKSPLTFSLLTNEYLESKIVDKIILKSASLDKSSQKYNLGLEIILK